MNLNSRYLNAIQNSVFCVRILSFKFCKSSQIFAFQLRNCTNALLADLNDKCKETNT